MDITTFDSDSVTANAGLGKLTLNYVDNNNTEYSETIGYVNHNLTESNFTYDDVDNPDEDAKAAKKFLADIYTYAVGINQLLGSTSFRNVTATYTVELVEE